MTTGPQVGILFEILRIDLLFLRSISNDCQRDKNTRQIHLIYYFSYPFVSV